MRRDLVFSFTFAQGLSDVCAGVLSLSHDIPIEAYRSAVSDWLSVCVPAVHACGWTCVRMSGVGLLLGMTPGPDMMKQASPECFERMPANLPSASTSC